MTIPEAIQQILDTNESARDALSLLDEALIHYQGRAVGSVAAQDTTTEAVNYDQCFVRDFVPCALVYLAIGRHDVVKGFLEATCTLQHPDWSRMGVQPGEGLMPASFKVERESNGAERLTADFGQDAIGRVAPVDAGLWWVVLLRAYTRASGDESLVQSDPFQRRLDQILALCCQDRFDLFPTMLVPDGACMIDRRMGINGHPLEIQALFHHAMRAGLEMLVERPGRRCPSALLNRRVPALTNHVRTHYWLDMPSINQVYRFRGEQFGAAVRNPYNIQPESIPDWLTSLMPDDGGYLAGNLGPAQLDFRFYALGNLLSVMSGLATPDQTRALLHFIDVRWQELVGAMPMKILYPAMKDAEWRILTGCDPKNRAWSYHNGGSWPVLLWPLTAACVTGERPELARRALDAARRRLSRDDWPEYYDGMYGRLVGRYSRLRQTWSMAGYLLGEIILAQPDMVSWLCMDCRATSQPSPESPR